MSELSPESIEQARAICARHAVASVSLIQRHLRVGYAEGCALLQCLVDRGVIDAETKTFIGEPTSVLKEREHDAAEGLHLNPGSENTVKSVDPEA